MTDVDIQKACHRINLERTKLVKNIPFIHRIRTMIPLILVAILLFAYGIVADVPNNDYGVNASSHLSSWLIFTFLICHLVWLIWFVWAGIGSYISSLDKVLVKMGFSDEQIIAFGKSLPQVIYTVVGFQWVLIVTIYSILFEGVGGNHMIYVMHDIVEWLLTNFNVINL